jgi:hypothetical protein
LPDLCASLLAAAAIVACAHGPSSERWSDYRPAKLDRLLQEAAAIHAAHPGIHFASGPKYKIQAVVVPKTRPLPSDVASFLTRWQQHWSVDHDLESHSQSPKFRELTTNQNIAEFKIPA